MITSKYNDMIIKLYEKTEQKQAIWNKGSRDKEFSISFKTGSFVIDKFYDSPKAEPSYDFQIYNNDGDKIYNSTKVDPENEGLYRVLELLHDSIIRSYYKVDEIILGFAEELDEDGITGESSSESSSSSSSSESSSSIS